PSPVSAHAKTQSPLSGRSGSRKLSAHRVTIRSKDDVQITVSGPQSADVDLRRHRGIAHRCAHDANAWRPCATLGNDEPHLAVHGASRPEYGAVRSDVAGRNAVWK